VKARRRKVKAKTRKRVAVRYILRLYVTGQTPRSLQSIANLRGLCEKYLKDQFDLEIIDIYQQPGLAQDDQIIATPTLIKEEPAPRRVLVGDFSRDDRVLAGLSLAPIPETS